MFVQVELAPVAHGLDVGVGFDDFFFWCVQRVGVNGAALQNVGPQRLRSLEDAVDVALAIRVAQEGAKTTGEQVFQDGHEEQLVKLKLLGALGPDLPHRVDPLQEDGRSLGVLAVIHGGAVAHTARKAVTKGQPVFFDEHDEPFDGAIVRIEQQLAQRHRLRGAIPAVGAVDQGGLARFDELRQPHAGQ